MDSGVSLSDLIAVIPKDWVLAAVFAYMWWLERGERQETAKLWRKEREQITQRIVQLANALKELTRRVRS